MRERRIPGAIHRVDNDCLFVFTMVPNSNGKRFRVRCACMAEIKMPRNAAAHQFHGYDHLGEVGSIAEGVALWTRHIAENGSQMAAGESA